MIDPTSYASFDSGYTQVGTTALSKVYGTLDLKGNTLTMGTGVAGDGGTLGGSGTILGSVNNLSGTIAPGDPQILTVNGNYSQAANGTLVIDINGNGGPGASNGNDELVIKGSGSLDGTLEVIFANGYSPQNIPYLILQSNGGASGTFATVEDQIPGQTGFTILPSSDFSFNQSTGQGLFQLGSGVSGGINYWTDSVGNWSVAGNWSLGLPANGQTVEISVPGHAQTTQTTLDGGSYSIANLISDANLNINGGSLNLDSTSASSQISGLQLSTGAELSTVGSLTITGSLTNAGTLSLSSGGRLTTNTNGIVNSGTISINTSSWSDSSNSVDNQATGTISAANGATLSLSQNGGTFSNEGSISLDNSRFQESATTFTNSGAVLVENGSSFQAHSATATNFGAMTVDSTSSASFDTGYTQIGVSSLSKINGSLDLNGNTLTLGTGVSGDGGTLGGSGMIFGSVNNLSGTISPGDPQILRIQGNYAQGVNGTSNFAIAGTGGPGQTNGNDELTVSGNLSLNGTVDVSTTGNFQPTLGQSFQLFTYGGTAAVSQSLNIVDPSDPSLKFMAETVPGISGGGAVDAEAVQGQYTETFESKPTTSNGLGIILSSPYGVRYDFYPGRAGERLDIPIIGSGDEGFAF